jgi:hypothetical protein
VAQRAESAGSWRVAKHYAQNLAHQRPQPRVIVFSFVIYDFIKANWLKVPLPPQGSVPPASWDKPLRCTATVKATSPLPRAATAAYPDALTRTLFTVNDVKQRPKGMKRPPQELVAMHWIMRDRRILREGRLRPGARYELSLVPYDSSTNAGDAGAMIVPGLSAPTDLGEFWVVDMKKAR